jgi:hypothetical protein
MSRVERLEPVFVDEVPRDIEPGKLYLSIAYTTAIHLCCCGCGSEVVTPLHPARWSVTYDGETVSLSPSVGSWALPCRSHYVIRRNKVRWARQWSNERIEAGRERDRRALSAHFQRDVEPDPGAADAAPANARGPLRRLLSRLRRGTE